MPLKQVVGISDFSGINRVGVDSSGRLLVNLGAASVTVDISGDPVTVSGNTVQISGQIVNTSGNVAVEFGTSLRTAGLTQATSLSGGVLLGSGAVFSVTMISISGNAPMWVGGVGSFAPFSGTGLIVYPGSAVSLKVNAVDTIRVFAETSGQKVSWLGVVQ